MKGRGRTARPAPPVKQPRPRPIGPRSRPEPAGLGKPRPDGDLNHGHALDSLWEGLKKSLPPEWR